MQRYDVYAADIGPKGFRVVEFDEYVTDETVTAVLDLLDDPQRVTAVTGHNYQLAARHYSYQTLSQSLQTMLAHLP